MNSNSATIYVVDDDVSVCRALSLLLKTHGFKVETFTRAAEFLAFRHPKVPSCLLQIFDKAKHLTQDAIVEGEEKIKEMVSEADKRVHKDPWPYIAGAATFSLLLGYLIGSKHK